MDRDRSRALKSCLAAAAVLLAAGCNKPTYPKEHLTDEVRKMFRQELQVEPRTELVGKTLYVSFEIEKLVTDNFELPEDVGKKFEDAMLSINRIGLSTDADIQFAVIEASDETWGVRTTLIRRMEDLKSLLYWRISQKDFEDRLILETKKITGDEPPDWHDISLEEYMSRWVASRITLGARSNPFMSVLLGIEKMTARYDPEEKAVHFVVTGYQDFKEPGLPAVSTAAISTDLLASSIKEQMAQVEAKYDPEGPAPAPRAKDWAKTVFVENTDGRLLLTIPRSEWADLKKKKSGSSS